MNLKSNLKIRRRKDSVNFFSKHMNEITILLKCSLFDKNYSFLCSHFLKYTYRLLNHHTRISIIFILNAEEIGFTDILI
jgi:hypothetical protein